MNRRKHLIIDKSFQLRLIFYIVLFSVIISLLLGFIVYLYDNLFIAFFEAKENARLSDVINTIISFNKDSFFHVAFFVALFSLFLTFFGLKQTHRIAGPVRKVRLALSDIRKMRFEKSVFFRKNDYFPDLADDFNKTVDVLEKTKSEANKALHETLISLQDLKINMKEDRESMEKIQDLVEKLENIIKLYGS